MSEQPWWYPKVTGSEWAQEMREENAIPADMDDKVIRDEYADGCKYVTLWDHTGDAYDDYEPLADAFLKATCRITALETEVRTWQEIFHDCKDNCPLSKFVDETEAHDG